MTAILLIRHGGTDWNADKIFRGRADIELNENGIKQAELLAQYLADEKIFAMFSSPLKRALKTAEIIARPHRIDIMPAPGLLDFDYGQWQGLSHHVVKEKYPALYAQWSADPQPVKIPGGESLDDVRKRGLKLIDEILGQYDGMVALVSHRVVCKVLICALLGLDNSHF